MTNPELDKVRLCKDCKWFRPSRLLGIAVMKQFAKCGHPNNVLERHKYVLVTGKTYPPDLDHYCATLREGYHTTDCGPSGQYWEAK